MLQANDLTVAERTHQVRLRVMNIFSNRKVLVFAKDKCSNAAGTPEADKKEDKAKICLNKNRPVFV